MHMRDKMCGKLASCRQPLDLEAEGAVRLAEFSDDFSPHGGIGTDLGNVGIWK